MDEPTLSASTPDEETSSVTPEVEEEFVLGGDPADVVEVAEGDEPFREGSHPDNVEEDLDGVDAEPPPTEDEDEGAPPSADELDALVADVDPDDVDDPFDDRDVVLG